MKTFIFLFYLICCMNIHASQVVSESLPIKTILMIEKTANNAQDQIDAFSQGKSFEEKQTKTKLLQDQSHHQIKTLIDDITTPSDLYVIAIVLYEGYSEFFTSLHDKILFQTLEYVVMRLAQLGTEEAYKYFIRLKSYYGTDGASSLIYRSLEFQYLKKYSKDPKVLEAKSKNAFV